MVSEMIKAANIVPSTFTLHDAAEFRGWLGCMKRGEQAERRLGQSNGACSGEGGFAINAIGRLLLQMKTVHPLHEHE